ncbi:tRNA (adenosine(37)-N6)-dimethylallyltransferase MiaA [Candidatus Falkowbacteria bacterium]|nr:tRNA (adenosine(37)-N6)-dimethylallyltransferase MiaA [Candidatus Falkowbacteria bacterium]
MLKKNKIIVILGPTASGKTGLAVRLAYKFNGEIVSADSRQVYRGMDVGTGKDLKDYHLQIPNSKFQIPNKIQNSKSKIQKRARFIDISHYLIDVVNPRTEFNLAKYQKLAYRAIDGILSRGKLPILVGGTGLYLQAVVDGYRLGGGGADKKLRKELEKMNADKLFGMLKKINPKWANRLNESDRKNKRRLIRYVEILKTRKDAKENAERRGKAIKKYDALIIGLTWPKDVLEKRIYKRLIERLEKENMVGEVRGLRKEGLSWKRLESFGLEYKYVSLYLQKKLTYEEMVEKLFIAIRRFAKRQLTWFRRWEGMGAKIRWVKKRKEAEKLISAFFK